MILSDLRDRMRSYANVDSDRLPDDAATDFINDAQDLIMQGGSKFRFGEELITFAFAANVQTVNPAPVVGRVLRPKRFWYFTSTSSPSQTDLDYVTQDEYIEKYGSAAQDSTQGFGAPIHYTIIGESGGDPTFYLGPIPDSDRTVYMLADITFDRFTDGTDDDTDNPLTVQLPTLVIYSALVLAAPFLEQEERVGVWKDIAAQQIATYKGAHSSARRSGMNNRSMQEAG